MKILAMTPSFNDAKVLGFFFNTLDALDPRVAYHLFATNNCTDPTPKMIDTYLKTHEGEQIKYNLPKDIFKALEEPYIGISIARQYLLHRAREIMWKDPSYTHALCLDTDIMVLDKHALTKVTEWGADIIGGSYMRTFPEGEFLATRFIKENGNSDLRRDIFYDICTPFVTSAGFLCLSRKVVLDERLKFSPIFKVMPNGRINPDTSEDFGFCILAQRLGYTPLVDGTIVLNHLGRPKDRGFLSDEHGQYRAFNYA
jgi:hypothetical protein